MHQHHKAHPQLLQGICEFLTYLNSSALAVEHSWFWYLSAPSMEREWAWLWPPEVTETEADIALEPMRGEN